MNAEDGRLQLAQLAYDAGWHFVEGIIDLKQSNDLLRHINDERDKLDRGQPWKIPDAPWNRSTDQVHTDRSTPRGRLIEFD